MATPFKRPLLQRGDVVEYRASHIAGMIQWAWLDGRIGVVEDGPKETHWGDNAGYRIQWISKRVVEDEDDNEKLYDTQLLTKIGHIELEPES